VWMLKGKMEFRLGTEQRVCSAGDVVVIPAGAEHEAWFREDTEVIDLLGSLPIEVFGSAMRQATADAEPDRLAPLPRQRHWPPT
jgi:quercetin dioxygenase-like cupin family protein